MVYLVSGALDVLTKSKYLLHCLKALARSYCRVHLKINKINHTTKTKLLKTLHAKIEELKSSNGLAQV